MPCTLLVVSGPCCSLRLRFRRQFLLGWCPSSRLLSSHLCRLPCSSRSTYRSSFQQARAQIAAEHVLAVQGDLPAKISAATMGKLKTCAICGGEGHNKATCPTIPANAARTAAGTRQRRRCSLCGQLGHRRDGCPTVAVRHLPPHVRPFIDGCGSGLAQVSGRLVSYYTSRRFKRAVGCAVGTLFLPAL